MPSQQEYLVGIVEGKNTTATILASQDLSTPIETYGASITALCFPDTFTGSSITFKVSPDGINYYNLIDGSTGLPYTLLIPSTAFAAVPVDLTFLVGFRWVILHSGSAQGSDTIIKVQMVPIINKDWN